MSREALECRRVTSEWAEPLGEFFTALEHSGDDRFFHPHPLTPKEAWVRAQYGGQDLYYVLVEGRRVLAYGMLRGWDEGYEVPALGIAVHPSERGKELAKPFMLFLHAAAKRKGARRIRLKVYSDNSAAVRLYRDLGYKYEAEEDGQLVGFIDL